MEKETLFVVERKYFTHSFSETRYNVPGDWRDGKYSDAKYAPYSSQIVGIFADKSIADEYEEMGYVNESVQSGECDCFGVCECYVHLSGHYHTVTEQQLETVIIKGKKYAEYGNKFIQVDERTSTTENQDDIASQQM